MKALSFLQAIFSSTAHKDKSIFEVVVPPPVAK
jgi:hypothetical protein